MFLRGWLGLLALCGSLAWGVPLSAEGAGTTIRVTSTSTMIDRLDGLCTLREALEAANQDRASGFVAGECPAGARADIIILPAGTYDYHGGTYAVTSTLTVRGAGPSQTIVRGALWAVGPTAVATFEDLAFKGNFTYNIDGGAIANSGVLTVANSLISDHWSDHGDGAGLYNSGTLTILNSRITRNHAFFGSGGGVGNTGSLTIRNSVIAENIADERGGGIYNTGSLSLTNSTISGNQTYHDEGGAVWNGGWTVMTNNTIAHNQSGSGEVGGLYNTPTATAALRHTILAENHQNNCGGTVRSAGYNLESGTQCAFRATRDISNTSPLLLPLAEDQGILIHGLEAGSPAIDSGDPAGCADERGLLLLTDQRGVNRPADGNGDGIARCDRGAYERLLTQCADYMPPTGIGAEDVMLIADHWRLTPSHQAWVPAHDLDSDGRITLEDVMQASAAWGGRC